MSVSEALRDPAITAVVPEAAFAHVAVETARGPHVTPVLYALAGDRLWFTVPRGTLKARILGKRPRAGILLDSREASVVLGGEARLLDPRNPLSWASAPWEYSLAPFAVQAFMLRNSRELIGFALDRSQLPAASFPPNLLLAGFEPRRVALVHGGSIESRWGRWRGGTPMRKRGAAPAGARRRRRIAPSALDRVPDAVAELPQRPGPAVIGWPAWGGPLALPASWDPDSALAVVADDLVTLAGIAGEAPACIAFDAAEGQRPTGKRGVMLRGVGTVVREDGAICVRVEPDRITYWLGFETGTVSVQGSPRE